VLSCDNIGELLCVRTESLLLRLVSALKFELKFWECEKGVPSSCKGFVNELDGILEGLHILKDIMISISE
jgi:hypothetical protein